MHSATLRLALVLFALVSAALVEPASAQGQAATVAQGQQLLNAGQVQEALEAFEEVANANPQDGTAWFYVGYCRHMLGDLDSALPAHKKAAQLSTGSTHQLALYNTACVYSLKGDLDESFSWLNRLKATGYNNPGQVNGDADLANARADARWATFMGNTAPDVTPFVETNLTVLHDWTGRSPGEQFGWVSADAGDVDGDGFADVIVGAPFNSTPQASGRVYVLSGKSGDLLHELAGAPGDRLGNSVDDAGDLNGDGFGDFLAGAPGYAGVPGRAMVYSGKDGSVLLELSGMQRGESFGDEVWNFGDVNADGKPDYVVGAEKFDISDISEIGADAGRVYVMSGADGSTLATLNGERAGDAFGSSTAGRLVDGEPMLVVGAMNAGEQQRGRVYVYKGDSLEQAFVIEGDATAKNYGRFFMSITGDLNGDEQLDIYSADFENAAKGPSTGRAYVHSGADGSLIYEWTGGVAGAGFGIGNAEAGDQNGDGVEDLVIGSWQNSQGAPQGGKVYVFSGADGSLLRSITGAISGDALGFDATGLGDQDGDGVPELLITAAYHASLGPQTGATYVVRGGVDE